MKFAYSWLHELVEVKQSPEKLAEFLSLHAFETEVLENTKSFAGIVVAKVTKVEKHPNADRLPLVTLTDGNNVFEPVVCGAWNFDVGAIVPLALPGAVIPHDQHDPSGQPFKLSKASIRGIESQGMICSAKELGLGLEGSGIMLLDGSYKLGAVFKVKSESSDLIFDVSVPANRPDLTSYRGVAREISALTGGKYKVKPFKSKIYNLKSKILHVRISEPGFCKKYIGVRLVNVKVGPAPKIIQDRLKLSGLRPINNVVDVTNYVMLETGQPLHAFDASKVAGPINIRKAYLNETIKTLDGIERKLSTETLVVADTKKALAIAGVIGGWDSSVTESTTEIILEAANFNAVQVRKTAKFLGLRTDASARFEKSLPISFAIEGAEYASELLAKFAKAKPVEFAQVGLKDEKAVTISGSLSSVNSLLGTRILATDQKKIWTKLGFQVRGAADKVTVSVPLWRPDVKIWQDLAEEVVRFVGLDKIPKQDLVFCSSASMSDKAAKFRDQVTDLLVGMGFDETYTYSFVSKAFFEKHGLDPVRAVEIENPLSLDQQYMRLGLGMNYEKLIEQNARYVQSGAFFEIGNVYSKEAGQIKERTNLFMTAFSKMERTESRLLGSLRELFQRLGVAAEIRQTEEQGAEVFINGKNLGHIRAVIDEEIKWTAVELNFEELGKHVKQKQFRNVAQYPARDLDVAILVKEDVPWFEIRETILKAGQSKLIQSVKLFDVYRGKGIVEGKKSVAFRIIYQAMDRTLTDEEVNKIHSEILSNLKSKLNAQIRD